MKENMIFGKQHHYNILTLQQRQTTVAKCKKTVAIGYQNGFSVVADRGVVLAIRYAFHNKQQPRTKNRMHKSLF